MQGFRYFYGFLFVRGELGASRNFTGPVLLLTAKAARCQDVITYVRDPTSLLRRTRTAHGPFVRGNLTRSSLLQRIITIHKSQSFCGSPWDKKLEKDFQRYVDVSA